MKPYSIIKDRIKQLDRELTDLASKHDTLAQKESLSRIEVERKEFYERQVFQLKLKIYELTWVLEK